MMKQLEINIPKLPYALEEAMNRLRVNIKFCGDQTRKLIRNSLHQIESCNGKLLGMVLNRVKINQHAYYKYYGEYGEYK